MILNANIMALIVSLKCKTHFREMKCCVILGNVPSQKSASEFGMIIYQLQSKWTGKIKNHSSRTFLFQPANIFHSAQIFH